MVGYKWYVVSNNSYIIFLTSDKGQIDQMLFQILYSNIFFQMKQSIIIVNILKKVTFET